MSHQITNEELLSKLRELFGRPDPIGFRRVGVPPPSELYMTRDDRLFVRVRNLLALFELDVAGRILQPNGEIVPFHEHMVPPLGTGAQELFAFDIGEGYLMSAIAWSSTASLRRGHAFVELGIVRGLTAALSVVQVLTKDYVTLDSPIGWPGGPIRSSTEGPGIVIDRQGTAPAAGDETSIVLPPNSKFRFMSVTADLITSLSGSDRIARLDFLFGANTVQRSEAEDSQGIVLQRDYWWLPVMGKRRAVARDTIYWPGAPLIIGGSGSITTATRNIDTDDQWSALSFYVERWIEE